MATTLTDPGVCNYNGVELAGPHFETLGAEVRTVESSDGRTSVANRYYLRIKTRVLNTNGTDATLEAIRDSLMRYGGRFQYNGKGFGTLDINGAGADDVMWGPKPKMLGWKPIGANLAAEITWEVEFCISDCNDNPLGRVMEFSWEVEYQQGPDRLTRRQIKGMLRIPNHKVAVNNKTVQDLADRYYEKVVPPIPSDFRRVNEQRAMTPDKSVLNFSVTDEQLEHSMPIGMIDWDVEITQHNAQPYLFNRWSGSISAWYKSALHVHPAWSMVHFFNLIQDRLKAAQGGAIERLFFRTVMPVTFNATEHPKDRKMSYAFTYDVVTKLPMLLLPGMWRPLPGHNNNLWAQSVAFAMAPRGYTNERFQPGYDTIVDLCVSDGKLTFPNPRIGGAGGGVNIARALGVSCPSPGDSWLYYRNAVVIAQDDSIVEHLPLPPTPKEPMPYMPGGPGFQVPDGYKPPPPEQAGAGQKNTAPRLQRRTAVNFEVWLIGYAARACYGVSAPNLISFAGAEAVSANRRGTEFYVTEIIGSAGVPIQVAQWRRRFLLKAYPTKAVKPPENPYIPAKDTQGIGTGIGQGVNGRGW